MLSIFWITALGGSLAALIQMILLMFGIGDSDADADVDSDIDAGFDFPIFTVKSFIGFIGGFGWGGLIGQYHGYSNTMQIVMAFGVGVVFALLVSTMLFFLSKLKHSGNLNIENAVGKFGEVYLQIPANGEETGVVNVIVQGALRELKATTNGDMIPTGSRVVVKQVIGNTLLVEKIQDKE